MMTIALLLLGGCFILAMLEAAKRTATATEVTALLLLTLIQERNNRERLDHGQRDSLPTMPIRHHERNSYH